MQTGQKGHSSTKCKRNVKPVCPFHFRMMAGNFSITGSTLNSDECLAGLLKRTSEIDHSIILKAFFACALLYLQLEGFSCLPFNAFTSTKTNGFYDSLGGM